MFINDDVMISLVAKGQFDHSLQDILLSLEPSQVTDEFVRTLIKTMLDTNDPRMWNLCALTLSDIKADALPQIEQLLFSEKSRGANATLAFVLNENEWILNRSIEEIEKLLEDNDSDELIYEIYKMIDRKNKQRTVRLTKLFRKQSKAH